MSGEQRNYRQLLEQRKGRRAQIAVSLAEQRERLEQLTLLQADLERAQVVIQEVAQLTQSQLKYHISELVTLALASVFEDPYEFEVDFVQKRNQIEADLWFVRDGERIKPKDASGGGPIDVAAFALRVSIWSLQKPRTRPILFLDEPFRFVSDNYRPKTCEMLTMVAQRLGLQIIMVTHSEELIDAADNVIVVTQKKGVSKAKQR